MNLSQPLKPAKFAEHMLLTAILEGEYLPGQTLPAERVLAEKLGVTRPTLRETLQRMSREGWITIRHGKSTLVNDYIKEGGMGLLSTLSRYGNYLSEGFVGHFLEVRAVLMPAISKKACLKEPEKIKNYLERAEGLNDDAVKFTSFDWGLQMLFASSSGNPIFRMMLNDFASMFKLLGELYFSHKEAREESLNYYKKLYVCMNEAAFEEAEQAVADIMKFSENFWNTTEIVNSSKL